MYLNENRYTHGLLKLNIHSYVLATFVYVFPSTITKNVR